MCAACKGKLTQTSPREKWCPTCARLVNRDENAGQNMRVAFESWLKGNGRPPYLSRATQVWSTPHRQAWQSPQTLSRNSCRTPAHLARQHHFTLWVTNCESPHSRQLSCADAATQVTTNPRGKAAAARAVMPAARAAPMSPAPAAGPPDRRHAAAPVCGGGSAGGTHGPVRTAGQDQPSPAAGPGNRGS